MGFHSFCTSDTRKSIAVGMEGYEGAPRKVYLLNPFGEAYEETNYNGYGKFGGEDVFALVAKWNAPEKCKDENGEWLPDDEIRNIGIHLACNDEDHVQLAYPIKIVEHLCDYERAGISPSCPFQGIFYPDDMDEIKEGVEDAFWDFDAVQEAYQNYVSCNGKEEEFLKKLNFDPYDKVSKAFVTIAAKHPETPERVLMEIAVRGDQYVAQDLIENPALPFAVLQELKKWEKDFFMSRKIKEHPNYKEEKRSLEDKIKDGTMKISKKGKHSIVEKDERDK